MQVTICGGGNAAHVLAALLSSRPEVQVNMYLPFGDEASRWRLSLDTYGEIVVNFPGGGQSSGCPGRISSAPAEVIPGSKIVLLALPAFAHATTLEQIAPYLASETWIGALPARGGFDLCARHSLAQHFTSYVIFGFQTLPWACRIQKYAQQATILGTKAQVDLAALPGSQSNEIAAMMSTLLGVTVNPIASFLSLTLAGTGQIIHPGIMYGLFHDWDGELYPEAPLFYQSVDTRIAGVLQGLSAEIQLLKCELEQRYPGIDLTAVHSILDWTLLSYAADIEDKSSLHTCFSTNRSYMGLRAPMRKAQDGLLPDFQARYLSEDIPFALVVTRGIAELCGLPTPLIDQIIAWAQARMGKIYLENGRLRGTDLLETRAPQRYGYHTLEAFESAALVDI